MVVMTVAGVTRSPCADRDVADDAGGRRGHPVVLQLHLVLADLRLDGVELRLRALVRGFGLVELRRG